MSIHLFRDAASFTAVCGAEGIVGTDEITQVTCVDCSFDILIDEVIAEDEARVRLERDAEAEAERLAMGYGERYEDI